jgi:hypothetical protein
MHDAVRAELIDLMKTGGRNLCTMPRVLAAMLRERCPDNEDVAREIEQALDCGCVSEMLRAVGPIDAAALAAELSSHSDLPRDRARWVIDSWLLAITAADEPPAVGRDWSAWNGLVAQGNRRGHRALMRFCAVALAGAAGGGTVEWVAVASPAWRNAVEGLPAEFGPFALSIFGYLGGATGGGLGWMAANGLIKPGPGPNRRRLVIGCLGAAIGGLVGAPAGLELFGLAGIMFGSLAGAFAGGLLAAVAAGYPGRTRS